MRDAPRRGHTRAAAGAGYSGTPLAQKLGIKPRMALMTIDAPAGYPKWIGLLPTGTSFVARRPRSGSSFVHLFVKSLKDLERGLPKARSLIALDGAVWVSWFKKSAGIPTDVTEDEIRTRALKTDLVDVKVCAVTEEWSGLKLVVRKNLRTRAA